MDVQEVLPRDAIPSIDDPTFGHGYFGDPDDEVIVVDGRPVAVTWCPICWSAVVYDRTVDGRALTFGTSGKLGDDALVMYDRETESEWHQPRGTAIDGPLDGTHLEALPSSMVTYEQFRAADPDGVVLEPARVGPDGSPASAYDMDRYEQYAGSEEFGLYGIRGEGRRRTWDREDIDAKTLVLGVERDGAAVGYPVPRVEAAGGVVTDTVGGLDVVVVAVDDGVHAFEDPGVALAVEDGRLRGDGTVWHPATGESDDGRRLERVPAIRLFAFAWQDAHGPGAFYG